MGPLTGLPHDAPVEGHTGLCADLHLGLASLGPLHLAGSPNLQHANLCQADLYACAVPSL